MSLKDGVHVVDVRRQGHITPSQGSCMGSSLECHQCLCPTSWARHEHKRQFWEDLEGLVRSVPTNEKLFNS